MAKQGFHRFAIGPGEEVNISAVLARDGKKLREFDAGRAETISKKDGKVTTTQTSKVSADGKTLTITTNGTNAGNEYSSVQVFTREKS